MGGSSESSVNVDETIEVWFKAEYAYDSESFTGEDGKLFINGEEATWDSSSNHWMLSVSSNDPITLSYSVTGITDDQYGLSSYQSDVADVEVEWKNAGIPGYPPYSILFAIIIFMFSIKNKNTFRKDAKSILFLIFIVFALLPAFSNCVLATDTTPPQLEISTEEGHYRNQSIILHGMAVDESGIRSVMINGENTTGTYTNIHYFWVFPTTLQDGVNTFTITATDNSDQHLTTTEELVVWYHPETYQGPSIKLVPVDSMPSNNASISCIVNPNGRRTYIYLNYAEKGTLHSPFNSGRGGWSDPLEGYEDILVTFKFEREEKPDPGNTIEYIFKVDNDRGIAYSEVGSFLVTNPIDLPPEPDTTPPDLVVSDNEGYTNKEYIVLHGSVWDESGVSHVIVNGEKANEFHNEGEWCFWTKNFWLEEGVNDISVTAFDNNNNTAVVESTITYQATGYTGPTIELVPHEDLPIDNAMMYFYVNPQGNANVGVYISSYSSDGGSGGQTIGHDYSGNQDILVSYLTPQEWLRVGEVRRNIIKVSRGNRWSFVEVNHTISPPDYIAPNIIDSIPYDGAISVSVKPEILVTFDEHLSVFTVDESTCMINEGKIPCSVTYDHENHTIIITPTTSLDFLTNYTVTITSDVSDYSGNSLDEDYSSSFMTVGPTIDRVLASNTRCDVNTTQYLFAHLGWGNGTDIESAVILVDDEEYLTNETGWISVNLHEEEVGGVQKQVTGVHYLGSTKYLQTVTVPEIIWDKVVFSIPQIQRVDVGGNFDWSGKYLFDNKPYTGGLGLNQSSDVSHEVGKVNYDIIGISDVEYGLTVFEANPFTVIYDKVEIELTLDDSRIDLGETPRVSYSGKYLYDSSVFEGSISLSDIPEEVDKSAIQVESISDSLYGLSEYTSTSVDCIWDTVKVTERGVSESSVSVDETVEVWFKAEYAYDSKPFTGNDGTLFINGEEATWLEDNRWILTVSSEAPAKISYSVTGITDDQYGLSSYQSDVADVEVEWKNAGIPGYPLVSILTALVLFVFLYSQKFKP